MDFLGISETWAKDEFPPIKLNGYNVTFKNRDSRGGGIAILLKKEI